MTALVGQCRIAKSQESRICADMCLQVQAFLNTILRSQVYGYLYAGYYHYVRPPQSADVGLLHVELRGHWRKGR